MQCSCGGEMEKRSETKNKELVALYQRCRGCGRVCLLPIPMHHSQIAQSLQQAKKAIEALDLDKVSHTNSQAILAAVQALNDSVTYRTMLVNVIWGKHDDEAN